MIKALEKKEMMSLARRGVFTKTTIHGAIVDYFYEVLPGYSSGHGAIMKARRDTAATFDVSTELVKKLTTKYIKG